MTRGRWAVITDVVTRLRQRRAKARPSSLREHRAPLPAATALRAPARGATTEVAPDEDVEASALEFLDRERRRRRRVAVVARATAVCALALLGTFLICDARHRPAPHPSSFDHLATVPEIAADGCRCRDLACVEAAERQLHARLFPVTFPGSPHASPTDAEIHEGVEAELRLEACKKTVPLPSAPYDHRPPFCPTGSTTAMSTPPAPRARSQVAAARSLGGIRAGPVIWSIADGHGGAHELCRDEGCLGWLSARSDRRLIIADLDGDGVPEVVRGEPTVRDVRGWHDEGSITVYRARRGGFVADPPWRGRWGEHLGARLAFVGDVDCDGLGDLAAVAAGEHCAGEGQMCTRIAGALLFIHVAPAGTRPTYYPVAEIDPGGECPQLAAGDVDGDGNVDVALLASGRPLELRRGGRGAIDAAPTWSYWLPEGGGFLLVDDDGDGDADLWFGDLTHSLSTVTRWTASPRGFDLADARTLVDPAGARQSWFGKTILAGAFTSPRHVELALSAHGSQRVYIASPTASAPSRHFAIDSHHLAAVDLDADGIDELAVVDDYTDHPSIVIHDARTGAIVARWPR